MPKRTVRITKDCDSVDYIGQIGYVVDEEDVLQYDGTYLHVYRIRLPDVEDDGLEAEYTAAEWEFEDVTDTP